jgi:hypothetical protein
MTLEKIVTTRIGRAIAIVWLAMGFTLLATSAAADPPTKPR